MKSVNNYKRILLKISGEALSGEGYTGFKTEPLDKIVNEIAYLHSNNVQVGLVVGGGNIVRGGEIKDLGFSRVNADYMGMMGTAINAIAISDFLTSKGIDNAIMSEIPIGKITLLFDNKRANEMLSDNKVIVFCCGTGSPFFTTDTSAALKAAEIGADVLFKATKVDGVYDSDPKKNPDAKKYANLTYDDILEKKLGVMDLTALTICRENNIPVVIFNFFEKNSVQKILSGQISATYIGGNHVG